MSVSVTGAHVSNVPRKSVTGRMERLPSSLYQTMLAWVLILSYFGESIDLGGMIFLMPVIAKSFHLDPKMMGYIGALSYAGMFFGSLLSGSLSDRIGRKKTLISAMAFWGIFTLFTAFASTVESLRIFRFLVGIGLGAQATVGITILSELVHSRSRGFYLTLYYASFPLGISIAGLITYLVLPIWDWRGVFAVEAVPALWLLIIWKVLPESARWLESKLRFAEADKIMDQIEDRVQKSTGKPLPSVDQKYIDVVDKEIPNVGFSELLTKPFIPTVVMVVIWQFTALLGFYGINAWLSALLVAKGFTVVKSTAFVALITLGGVPAFVLVNYLLEKIGRKWTAASMGVITAITAFIYGSAPTVVLVIVFGLVYMFFQYGYAMANNAYLPELFPTHIRGRGVGFGLVIGRAGAFTGPILLGYIMAAYGPTAVFLTASGLIFIGSIAIMLLGTETRGKVF